MRRFSVRTLMALIVVCAVGLAALRSANEVWAGIMPLVALATVGTAAMGAFILRGWERHWWAGFAFFGGTYLTLAVAPWLSDTVQPQLGTSQLLRHAHERMYPSALPPLGDAELVALQNERSELSSHLQRAKQVARHANDPTLVAAKKALANIQTRLAAHSNAAPTYDQFRRVCLSLSSLLSGLLGGTVALWFYARRERHEAN